MGSANPEYDSLAYGELPEHPEAPTHLVVVESEAELEGSPRVESFLRLARRVALLGALFVASSLLAPAISVLQIPAWY